MDNVTHSLFALTLARTPLGRTGRGATAALLLASNAPDVDFLSAAGGALTYLEWHRGPTHGPLGVIGLGLLTAGLVHAAQRAAGRRGSGKPCASPAALIVVSIIGVLMHVLMDLPTSYGTRLLSPFDWHWFALDWLPIIDVYLLAILGGGLLAARYPTRDRPGRSTSVMLTLALMAAYYGCRGLAHDRAIASASAVFEPTLPGYCVEQRVEQAQDTWSLDRWPREQAKDVAHPCLLEVAAIPTFGSPFRWRLIAHLSNAFQVANVSVLERDDPGPPGPGDRQRSGGRRYANNWTPAVMVAATSGTAKIFLGFSRFPVVRTEMDDDGITTVAWTDLRFGDPPSGDPLLDVRRALFASVVRVGPDGSILEHRLGR